MCASAMMVRWCMCLGINTVKLLNSIWSAMCERMIECTSVHVLMVVCR